MLIIIDPFINQSLSLRAESNPFDPTRPILNATEREFILLSRSATCRNFKPPRGLRQLFKRNTPFPLFKRAKKRLFEIREGMFAFAERSTGRVHASTVTTDALVSVTDALPSVTEIAIAEVETPPGATPLPENA